MVYLSAKNVTCKKCGYLNNLKLTDPTATWGYCQKCNWKNRW